MIIGGGGSDVATLHPPLSGYRLSYRVLVVQGLRGGLLTGGRAGP